MSAAEILRAFIDPPPEMKKRSTVWSWPDERLSVDGLHAIVKHDSGQLVMVLLKDIVAFHGDGKPQSELLSRQRKNEKNHVVAPAPAPAPAPATNVAAAVGSGAAPALAAAVGDDAAARVLELQEELRHAQEQRGKAERTVVWQAGVLKTLEAENAALKEQVHGQREQLGAMTEHLRTLVARNDEAWRGLLPAADFPGATPEPDATCAAEPDGKAAAAAAAGASAERRSSECTWACSPSVSLREPSVSLRLPPTTRALTSRCPQVRQAAVRIRCQRRQQRPLLRAAPPPAHAKGVSTRENTLPPSPSMSPP